MSKRVFDIVSVTITALAVISASAACVIWFYQPKTPKCLL
jgi:cyclic lactone autoinducer peptide